MNQWISYIDKEGKGFAQTDFYIVEPTFILLFEMKLTYTESAFAQMKELYVPLLEKIYQVPVVTMQVCKILYKVPRYTSTPEEQLASPVFNANITWHYPG